MAVNDKQKADLFEALTAVLGPIVGHLALSTVVRTLDGGKSGKIDLPRLYKDKAERAAKAKEAGQ